MPAAATEKLLAQYIQDSKATDNMKERFQAIFMENNTKEQTFQKYLALLEKEANAEYRKKVQQKMIDEPAPNFSLVNLDGETVQLSDYQGKVVVLDFWATWCGPCKASFPAMQEALDKQKDNEEVVFLFINSWERKESNEEEEEVVRQFIEKNEYTFNVPMDYDDEVIKSYKVDGIPTKFVISPDGQIRFKSVGFAGSNAEMIKELMMMVEIAAQRDNASASLD
jgi:peroxiredoxin